MGQVAIDHTSNIDIRDRFTVTSASAIEVDECRDEHRFINEVEQLKGAPLSEPSKSKVRSFMAIQDPSHDLIGTSASRCLFT